MELQFLLLLFFAVCFCILASPYIDESPARHISKRSPFFPRKGYLSSTYETGMKGGLGHQLFELLSILGIADQLNRYPYIRVDNKEVLHKMAHIHELFPRLQEQFSVVYWNVSETIISFNKEGCCVFDDPKRLKKIANEYVVLQGDYFQSYKYFDHLRKNIREWLQPNKLPHREAEIAFPQQFQNRRSFMICAHTRREDYVTDRFHEASDANFSSNALMYLMIKYQAIHENVGVLVFGDDSSWNTLTFAGFPQVTIMRNSPGADLAMSTGHCDVVLLTAPSSTFGFFMGYFSKGFRVYYRDIQTTTDAVQNHMVQEDYYPVEWIKIQEVGGIIQEFPTSSSDNQLLHKK